MTESDDPVAVFEVAARALHAGNWRAVTALMDPVSLAVFKRNMVSALTPAWDVMTVDQLLKYRPGMPRAAAEYEVERMALHQQERKEVSSEFAGVDSIEALLEMKDEDAFAAWLEAHSMKSLARRTLKRKQITESQAAEIENFDPFRYEAIGAVRDRNVAYVLYRTVFGDSNDDDVDEEWRCAQAELSAEERQLNEDIAAGPSFVTVRRQSNGDWRIIAELNFMNLSNMFFDVGPSIEVVANRDNDQSGDQT